MSFWIDFGGFGGWRADFKVVVSGIENFGEEDFVCEIFFGHLVADFDGWNPLQKFMPDELQNKVTNDNFIGDLFGQSVSVNNDSIWCSAPNRDINGTLFIFKETVSAPSEDILINQNPDSNYDFPQSTIVKQYSNLTDYETRVPNNYYLENTEELSKNVISLPIHTEIENSSQDFIIEKVLNFFK